MAVLLAVHGDSFILITMLRMVCLSQNEILKKVSQILVGQREVSKNFFKECFERGVWLCAGFSIEGPSQAKIECDDKGDGSCDVRYWPTEPGDYAVHVICDDEDIKDSPFMAHILPAANDVFPENVGP